MKKFLNVALVFLITFMFTACAAAADKNEKIKFNKGKLKKIELLTSPVHGSPMIVMRENYSDVPLFGEATATQQQMIHFINKRNPNPKLNCTVPALVSLYWLEASREGIRPDIAMCQAIKETGTWAYGGDVIPEQNNYCGLGTTGGGVKGAFFANPQLGVRAHIQHLLAYSSTRRPIMPVVDPRYGIVRQAYGSRTLGTWQDLNGRWAVPGNFYGQEILSMFRDILIQ